MCRYDGVSWRRLAAAGEGGKGGGGSGGIISQSRLCRVCKVGYAEFAERKILSPRPPGFIGEVTQHQLATTIITGFVVVLSLYVDRPW